MSARPAGALLLAAGARAELGLAGATPAVAAGAARTSRITRGTVLVHADLHNHTLLSDGHGDVEDAFPSMRAAGLDVAALTDHAIDGRHAGPGAWARGLVPATWQRAGEVAARHDEPGAFTAIRGFEWSHPHLGHVNTWFTEDWTDVATDGRTADLFAWLTTEGRRAVPGVPAGLAGFNHPGREWGRFADFAFDPAARDQLVGLEMFNRTEDYLFEGVATGAASPLVACLAAGWRPGLLGVSDEHGTDWGFPEGKGRAGLWVTERSRAGVAEALRARRTYATRVSGLRIDATAGGVRMGSVLRHRRGTVPFALDVDRGELWRGERLRVQVLRPGPLVPEVVDALDVRCGDVARFDVPLDLDDGGWVVLRLADPSGTNDNPGPAGHPAGDRGLAYTSPWYLEP